MWSAANRAPNRNIEALHRVVKESERTTGLIEDLMVLARRPRPPLAETAGVTLRVNDLNECSVARGPRALRRLLPCWRTLLSWVEGLLA